MIIDEELLTRFNACEGAKAEFIQRFPDGIDVSTLWGTAAERAEKWQDILADKFLRRYIGGGQSKLGYCRLELWPT